MKRLQATFAALLITLNLCGQGVANYSVVNFSNQGGTDAEKVWAEGGLAGSAYHVALYFDPNVTGSPDAAFIQVGPAVQLGRFTTPGIFIGGPPTIPLGDGEIMNFQVRGWEANFGIDYETARAAGGDTGKSGVFRMDTAIEQEPRMNVLGTDTFTTGWTGFAIVPEPSVIGICLLGSGALLLLARRK